MYLLSITPEVDKIFHKLLKKDKKQVLMVFKKIEGILENPDHFKPLSGEMQGKRRVHIDSSFVLVYEVDEKNKTVTLIDYDHHDNIYN